MRVLAGYRVWDDLQLGDVVEAIVATTCFTVSWVLATAKAINR